MLAEFGCRYVIVGHSERRQMHGETDALVAAKAQAALAAGLTPIVCVGETLAEREAGATEAVVARQLDAVVDGARRRICRASSLAYEPVWAIGTGRTATPEQAQEVHAFLRERLAQGGRGGGAACCTAAASRPPTRRRCSRCRTSTADWSAARRWMRTEFLAIARA